MVSNKNNNELWERVRERESKSEGALSNKESPESAAEQFSP